MLPKVKKNGFCPCRGYLDLGAKIIDSSVDLTLLFNMCFHQELPCYMLCYDCVQSGITKTGGRINSSLARTGHWFRDKNLFLKGICYVIVLNSRELVNLWFSSLTGRAQEVASLLQEGIG